jgi:hypothetical protein
VYDAVAVPVAGATVYACPSGLSATTGLTGTYSIAGVPAGDIVVKAAFDPTGFGLAAALMTDGGSLVIDVVLASPYASPECV